MRASLFLALALFAVPAWAQQMSGFGISNPNAPIDVSADHFGADLNSKQAVYTGNVVIHQGDLRMRADAVRVAVVGNKPDKIYAQGHIVVDAPSGIATGDSGVYDVNPRIITLSGNVVLTRDKNVMSGNQLTVNLLTGIAQLAGGEGKGGRVHGIFTPSALQTQKN